MNSVSLVVLSLAIFGASASPCGLVGSGLVSSGLVGSGLVSSGLVGSGLVSSGLVGSGLVGSGLVGVSSGCGSALPGPTFVGQTPVVENPTSYVPSIIPPVSVSQSCQCQKTIVRPQIRNEIITVPQVDRLVRYVPSPVYETFTTDSGINTRSGSLPTCGTSESVVGGLVSGGLVSGGLVSGGLVSGGLVSGGLVSGGLVSGGLVSGGLVSGCGNVVSSVPVVSGCAC